jgi:hypothetical protein
MDNINLYRGRRRHLRLINPMGPKMWNFTGKAAIIPNLEGSEDLMSCKETATMPQTDIASLKVEEIFLCKYYMYTVIFYVLFQCLRKD